MQFDGRIWFDEGSVFTTGPDDTLVVLGGTKSETYWSSISRSEVNFIGQYFDASKNKWKPLNYSPDTDLVMNFPLRYQETVQDPSGLVWLFRTNEVNYNESTDDVGLWRDGPTYQVTLGTF